MSDIGDIFSAWDIVLMALVVGSPGLVVGALIGAVTGRHRLLSAGIGGGAGFVLMLAAVFVYLTVIK